jgi:hypothetical protein
VVLPALDAWQARYPLVSSRSRRQGCGKDETPGERSGFVRSRRGELPGTGIAQARRRDNRLPERSPRTRTPDEPAPFELPVPFALQRAAVEAACCRRAFDLCHGMDGSCSGDHPGVRRSPRKNLVWRANAGPSRWAEPIAWHRRAPKRARPEGGCRSVRGAGFERRCCRADGGSTRARICTAVARGRTGWLQSRWLPQAYARVRDHPQTRVRNRRFGLLPTRRRRALSDQGWVHDLCAVHGVLTGGEGRLRRGAGVSEACQQDRPRSARESCDQRNRVPAGRAARRQRRQSVSSSRNSSWPTSS